MANLFQGAKHASLYMKYRPTYPKELYDAIFRFCGEDSRITFDRVVDLGCGSGQSTRPLCQLFKHVVGVDPSAQQVKQAQETTCSSDKFAGDVHYRVGTAEDLSYFKDSSVELLSCGQAFHWVNTDRFYPEAKRVLTPGGVLAAYGYGNVKLDREAASDLIWKFYRKTLGGYWEPGRRHIDNHLSSFKLPFDDFHRIDDLMMTLEMDIDGFVGYLSSWSAYRAYMEEKPDTRVLDKIRQRLMHIYGPEGGSSSRVVARWPLFLLLARQR